MKNEKKECRGVSKNWNIPSDTHTSFQKAFQSVEEEYAGRRYPPIALQQSRCMIHKKPPFIIMPLVTLFL